jgi:hypothetical protein
MAKILDMHIDRQSGTATRALKGLQQPKSIRKSPPDGRQLTRCPGTTVYENDFAAPHPVLAEVQHRSSGLFRTRAGYPVG